MSSAVETQIVSIVGFDMSEWMVTLTGYWTEIENEH